MVLLVVMLMFTFKILLLQLNDIAFPLLIQTQLFKFKKNVEKFYEKKSG